MQFQPHILCAKPKQEIQSKFGGPIYEEKGNKVYFNVAIDRFSKCHTACIFDKANGPNATKFLDIYIQNHIVPRKIQLDQSKCLLGY